MAISQPPVLVAEDLVVSFDGFRVIDDLGFTLHDGELRFLIGPNGAGKTTFMDVISGKIRADSGRVMFDADTGKHPVDIEMSGDVIYRGKNLTTMREDQIVDMGVGRKFQTPSVFGSLTCYENVEVAAGHRDWLYSLLLPTSRRRRDRIMNALERAGLMARSQVTAAELSHGERQWLEIGMLLVQDPKLLLLDEPVAGMTGQERDRTGELLHSLEGDHTLIVTEHDMDFIRQFSRTVTVLHQGALLCEGSVEHISQDPAVQEVYIGRAKEAV